MPLIPRATHEEAAMSTAVLDKLCTERDEVRSAALAIAESDGFKPDDQTYVELRARATELDTRITSLAELLDQQQAADQLDGRLAKAAQSRQQRSDREQQVQTRESLGRAFVRSAIYEQYAQSPGGKSNAFEWDPEDGDVQSRALPMSIADLVAAGLKGAPYQVDNTAPTAPTPLLDNVNQVQVSGNAIEIIAWNKVAGGAAVTPEETLKPSAEYAPAITPAVLQNIAVWTSMTTAMVEDYNTVRSYLDGALRREIQRAEEADATAVVAAAASSIPDATSDTLLGAIRVGMGTVQAAGYTPTAVLLNPADWAEMDVAVMGDTLNGPRVNQSFWGMTPIPSTAQTAGTAIVGNFQVAVTRFYRSQIQARFSDSAKDQDFLKNIVTLLLERRSKTAVIQPQALAEAKTA
jgi:hypothetical protein